MNSDANVQLTFMKSKGIQDNVGIVQNKHINYCIEGDKKTYRKRGYKNTNGLIRQYQPKYSSFDHISEEKIQICSK